MKTLAFGIAILLLSILLIFIIVKRVRKKHKFNFDFNYVKFSSISSWKRLDAYLFAIDFYSLSISLIKVIPTVSEEEKEYLKRISNNILVFHSQPGFPQPLESLEVTFSPFFLRRFKVIKWILSKTPF